jgi:hypothetical protein
MRRRVVLVVVIMSPRFVFRVVLVLASVIVRSFVFVSPFFWRWMERRQAIVTANSRFTAVISCDRSFVRAVLVLAVRRCPVGPAARVRPNSRRPAKRLRGLKAAPPAAAWRESLGLHGCLVAAA